MGATNLNKLSPVQICGIVQILILIAAYAYEKW
jgi:hypothetical protein